MPRIIAIANQKGGVGKTTTAVNLSSGLAHYGKKVLLIDMDPQANTTRGIGCDYSEKSLYDVLYSDVACEEIIYSVNSKLDLLPASINLATLETKLASLDDDKYFLLKNNIETVAASYDFVIIDCPPSLGFLNINALVCASSVLIPMQCEYYAMEGIAQLLNTIHGVQIKYNSSLTIEGVLLTMCDYRTKFAVEIQQEMRHTFKETVYSFAIPRNIKVAEAPSKGKSVIDYNIKASGSIAYLKLAKEVINHAKIEQRKVRSVH